MAHAGIRMEEYNMCLMHRFWVWELLKARPYACFFVWGVLFVGVRKVRTHNVEVRIGRHAEESLGAAGL